MSLKTSLLLALLAVATGTLSSARAQARPTFAGRWILNVERSRPPVAVWGRTRARVILIRQDAASLSVATEDGGLGVPAEVQRYRLDGESDVFLDRSLGDLPNFTRKVRTAARWRGNTLTIETESVSESLDERTRTPVTGHGITRVWSFWLEGNGRELVVERTGFRNPQPAELHGQPYRQQDDFAYNVDLVRYDKADQ